MMSCPLARSRTKVLHKLVVDRCSQGGTYEDHLMAILLSVIGPELKHVSIFDRSSTCTGLEASKGKPPRRTPCTLSRF